MSNQVEYTESPKGVHWIAENGDGWDTMIDRSSIVRPVRILALKPRILFVLAALGPALAGCQGGDSSPVTSAVGAPSPSGATAGAGGSSAAVHPATPSTVAAATSATGCPEPIATNTYVRAVSARAEGSTVVVTANPAQRVCGGADNGHYEVAAFDERLSLTASATVVVLTTTPRGLGHRTVAATSLPQRLRDDRFGRIFLVRGPASAVTSLEEQFHP